MTYYLISFPSGEMDLEGVDLRQAADDAHAVMRDAKAAGVYVFGGGIEESVAPVRVDAAGGVREGTYPQTARIEGGYAILDLPSREAAVEWAARIAAACRCEQELREFMPDPER
ncbi:YciI family protein [Homoserinibacter sp. YIM 151385]|uniref:YciI family protein n=1 Tax=Homoserinibacter sp. YIM 151385 TaxID=2985506 RepID=UPI0022EFFA3C|nr:YciI family protein [Homoserinibacter sp. YIM 151385]WBU36730.1 YciI family protein [Homoserinibacter sp. YIM 151385]